MCHPGQHTFAPLTPSALQGRKHSSVSCLLTVISLCPTESQFRAEAHHRRESV